MTPKAKESEMSEWAVYRRLLNYAKPYKTRIVVGLVFGSIFGSSFFGMLMALKQNLAVVFDPAELNWIAVISALALLPAAALVMGVGNFASKYFISWVGNRVVMDLRTQVFAHIHDLSLLYFTSSRTGELISRTTNDSALVQQSVSTVLGDLVREPFVLIAAVGYLFWLDPLLSVVSLVLFPVCIIPVAIFGWRVRKATREGQALLADLVTILQESLVGVRIVKAFGMEQREKDRFNKRNRAVFSRLMRIAKARAAVEPIIVVISASGLGLVLLYARWQGMTSDEFFTFAAALMLMYQPVKRLSRISMHIQQSSAAAERLFEVLDTEITVSDRPDARPLGGKLEQVEFKQVSFSYGDEMVLSGINLCVKAGTCVAFVGSSGSGKTTLVSLVPRFFDVTAGALLVNGCDVREYQSASLRRYMGVVTQETILFNDTVGGNIAYGAPQASEEMIIEAAKKAHAHEFISALPEGYDTVIGEQGIRLSGGQRQRLCIARAMLCNPPLMILDEATSALDTESECAVQAALEELMNNRTVLAIAHRLSTIRNADLIVVLEQGRIVEQGSHEELIELGGTYKRLYDLQFAPDD